MKKRFAWMLRSSFASGVMAAAVACTSQEFTVEQPDGTVQTYRQIQVHPHLVVRPDQFEVRPAGVTDDGFPVEVIVRRDGKGEQLYRVMPPVGEPLFFRRMPAGKSGPGIRPPTETEVSPQPTSEVVAYDAFRARVDLSIDSAELEGRRGSGPWVPVARGDIAAVTRVAAGRGVLPLEIENELGVWRITADRRFPMVTVRHDGEVLQVRGLP